MATEPKVPDRIFHYTSASGLLGILEHRQLWVSDIEFLNDEQEVRYAVGLLNDALRDRRELIEQEAQDSPETHDSWARIVSLIREIDARYPQTGSFHSIWERTPFVTSFCGSGDLLSMWRGYSDGTGFSIEFDTHVLLDVLSEQPYTWELTDEEQARMLATNFSVDAALLTVEYGWDAAQAVIDRLFAEIDSEDPVPAPVRVDRLASELIRIKHPAFVEESEIRLLIYPRGDLSPRPRLRSGRGHLVPYFPIEFPHKAIRSICVGPSPYRSRSAVALERALKVTARGEWAHVEIATSHAPLLY